MWRCPRDDSLNTGERCAVCGKPPFLQAPMLKGDRVSIKVTTSERIVGRLDFSTELRDSGVSHRHVRIYYNSGTHKWRVCNITKSGVVKVDGTRLDWSKSCDLPNDGYLEIGAIRLQVQMADT